MSIRTKAYIAGFLDGDGSIYVRLKPNTSYRFGFQIAPYIVFFQSRKEKKNFEKICSLIGFGYMRVRKDGILEYTINRVEDIRKLLKDVIPFLVLKKKQAELMLKILDRKEQMKNKSDFVMIVAMIDKFRQLNYSKKRKRHTLTL
jgi:hypothetical protein